MVEILALVLRYDEQAVLCTVEVVLEPRVPTKTHIFNSLHQLVDGEETEAALINAPQALILRQEPKARAAHYDDLLKGCAGFGTTLSPKRHLIPEACWPAIHLSSVFAQAVRHCPL